MKKPLYFLILSAIPIITSLLLFSCDSAEDEAEDRMTRPDTTMVLYDTIRTKTEIKFVPVKFELVIEIASFKNKENADRFKSKTDSLLNKTTEVLELDNHFIVTVGRFTEPDKANAFLEYIKSRGYPQAFIKKIKKSE
jgi:hypothetical protein